MNGYNKHKLKHGYAKVGRKPKEYQAWISMLRRCYTPSASHFRYYGGRGIKVCKAWRSPVYGFQTFLKAVGKAPLGMTLERIKNNKNYKPGNVKWVTHSVNCRNRRSCRIITFKGESLPIIVWCERTKVSYQCLYRRLKSGWTVEDALTTKVRRC